MRLFTEEDVELLLAEGLRRDETARQGIERMIDEGYVEPFVLEVPGSPEQARSFQHWVKTGEIPDWRKEQIADEAVKEAVADLRNTTT